MSSETYLSSFELEAFSRTMGGSMHLAADSPGLYRSLREQIGTFVENETNGEAEIFDEMVRLHPASHIELEELGSDGGDIVALRVISAGRLRVIYAASVVEIQTPRLFIPDVVWGPKLVRAGQVAVVPIASGRALRDDEKAIAQRNRAAPTALSPSIH
ncbi:hypothetical protein A3709_20420 [Halioglobus sp. HI00S01]|uniref:hypothetical protein n=1 Tax=Halioglobus sp. HI00S01 TaxID=1822214 RepID=UPI0007C2E6B8|nr:hypothetical protein [Halioglobus sp. HI00S01]KZX57978.1 hypothetical protein A3709_20420 [Halioglobus sp. HI00S01]